MPIDAVLVARKAKLKHVNREGKGYSRKRRGKAFAYFDQHGKRITNAEEIQRINSLAIPPAYKDVWICPNARGHLQAVGTDDRGRLQYRYHPEFREAADRAKFEHLAEFGRKLPEIRRIVRSRLRKAEPTRDRVLAAAMRMLEVGHLRVGNAEYARDNQSFGLTTLRPEHATLNGKSVRLTFVAKGGLDWDIELKDAPLSRMLRECVKLGGKELLCYRNDRGEVVDVTSSDVNDEIKRITGDGTAKDFRTWQATVTAAAELDKAGVCDTKRGTKANIAAAAKATAEKLGHTPAVCRKSYIHPQITMSYELGTLCQLLHKGRRRKTPAGLNDDERAVLAVLERG